MTRRPRGLIWSRTWTGRVAEAGGRIFAVTFDGERYLAERRRRGVARPIVATEHPRAADARHWCEAEARAQRAALLPASGRGFRRDCP